MVSASTRAEKKRASGQKGIRYFSKTLPAGAALSVAAMALTPLLAAGAQASVHFERELIEPTAYQLALEDTQNYKSSSAIVVEPLVRVSYSATTAEEIQAIKEKRAQKEAEERAKREAKKAKEAKEAEGKTLASRPVPAS